MKNQGLYSRVEKVVSLDKVVSLFQDRQTFWLIEVLYSIKTDALWIKENNNMHKNQGPDSRDDNQQTDMRAHREVTLSIIKNI